jgi:hypothetical protein
LITTIMMKGCALGVALIVLLSILTDANGFFQNLGGQAMKVSTPAKGSPLAQEAVEIFGKKYPFGRPPPKTNIMGSFGYVDTYL